MGEHLLCKQGGVGSIPSTSIWRDAVAEGKRDRASIERSVPDGAWPGDGRADVGLVLTWLSGEGWSFVLLTCESGFGASGRAGCTSDRRRIARAIRVPATGECSEA